MLKRISPKTEAMTLEVPISEMTERKFPFRLEYNAPVHGTWNIVHIGMSVPQSHHIYVASDNCLRGVILTAAEMEALDRFSSVMLEESDFYGDNLETVTIEGVSSVIDKLPVRPPAVMVFLVCLHHFMGSDTRRIYGELEKRYPDIDFYRCWMDPIMQKRGYTPEQKLRREMFSRLDGTERDDRSVSIMGSDFRIPDSSELVSVLEESGFRVRQLQTSRDYAEFKRLGESGLMICTYPTGAYGVQKAAERLDRDYLYLLQRVDPQQIREELDQLCDRLSIERKDWGGKIRECREALDRLRAVIGDTPVVIDSVGHPCPLGLAKLLISSGFHVKKLYLDAISGDEEEEYRWLCANAPGLPVSPTTQPEMRYAHRLPHEKVLAVGQKAAWFEQTPHFVNLVEGGGLWGFTGLLELLRLMEEAFLTEKDLQDIVPRKGLGCASCI